MRISLGFKLAAVVGLLGLVAIGLSVFAVRQTQWEQERAAATDKIWNAGLQAGVLGQTIEHAVVEATALYTADSTAEARSRLSALHEALAAVEQARSPFLQAMEEQLPEDRRRRFDLFVKEFIAYQNDTAELGLTISPKAALIQATDEATVKNREHMVPRSGSGAGSAESSEHPPGGGCRGSQPSAAHAGGRAGRGARLRASDGHLDHRHAGAAAAASAEGQHDGLGDERPRAVDPLHAPAG